MTLKLYILDGSIYNGLIYLHYIRLPLCVGTCNLATGENRIKPIGNMSVSKEMPDEAFYFCMYMYI